MRYMGQIRYHLIASVVLVSVASAAVFGDSSDTGSSEDAVIETEQATDLGTVLWDTGFEFRSADGNFGLDIGGWLQPRFEYTHESDDENITRFRLRRARLDFRGHVFDERLTYRLMSEFAGNVTLRDGWIDYAFDEAAHLRAGQFTVPFQWHRFIGPRHQHFG